MAEQDLTAYLTRQRRVNTNTWPLDGSSKPVLEGSAAPYHWQPETLWYRDAITGNEVCMLVYPHKVQHLFSTEYASHIWSPDGKRLGLFSINSGASLGTRDPSHNASGFAGGSVYRRFVMHADGSNMRLQYGAKGHGEFGDGSFGWYRTVANANKYVAFVSHAATEGGSIYELYEMALTDNNTPIATLKLNTKTAANGDDSFGTIISTALGKTKLKRAIDANDTYLLAVATTPDHFGLHMLCEGIIRIRLSDWAILDYWGVARGITETYGKSGGQHMGPALINGGFDSSLTGWTDASTGGGSAAQSGGKAVLTAGGGTAILRQSFTAITPIRSYAATIAVSDFTGGGTVSLKVGSTLGGAEYINKTYTAARASSASLDGGLTFSPTAGSTVYVQVEYTGGTSAAVDCVDLGNEYKHHGGGLWGLDATHLILLYTNTSVIFWRMKITGSDVDGGPKWEAYDAATGMYGANDVVPFSADLGGNIPKQYHNSYWGHPSFSPRGDYMIFGEYNDTNGLVPGTRVVRVSDGAPLISWPQGNLTKDLMPSNNDYDGRHHTWDSFSDHVGFFPNYVNQRFMGMRWLYGRCLDLVRGARGPAYAIADTYGTTLNATNYTAYPRPVASPDGTKIAYSTGFPMQLTPINNLSGSSLGDWSDVSSGTGSVVVADGIATLSAGASGVGAIEFAATIPQKAASPFATYAIEVYLESGSAPSLTVGSTPGGTDILASVALSAVSSVYASHVNIYYANCTFLSGANNATTAYFRLSRSSGSAAISGIRILNTNHLGIAYAVAYYPKPPTITGATKNAGNVRLAFTPPVYNPTTGNDAPKEIKGYHVWSTTDSTLQTGWAELTTSAVTGTTYDYAQTVGTTRYYALTTEEHSRLESDYLSNVWKVTLDGAGTITIQVQHREEGLRDWWTTAPSAPTLAASSFAAAAVNTLSWTVPADTTKIRYYNIYYSSSGAPATTAANRIASIPPTYFDATNVEQNHTTWKDWLHDTSATAYYAMTSVDRYGNETGVQRVPLPSTRERHRMQPFSAAARPAASARPPKN